MASQLNLVKQLLLVVSPVVASSAIAIAPSQAATFAYSEARTEIIGFNQEPLSVNTISDTDTFTFAGSGFVTADAEANAAFDIPLNRAENLSLSAAAGEGSNYLGLATSTAQVIGEFFVENDLFSFDFLTFLGLATSADPGERTHANGSISFELYKIDQGQQSLLDSFTLLGSLSTPGSNDFLTYTGSEYFQLTAVDTTTDFTGSEESATAQIQGKFSRYFETPTYLTLVEVKNNNTNVSVPESSNSMALFAFGILGVGAGLWSKRHRPFQLDIASMHSEE